MSLAICIDLPAKLKLRIGTICVLVRDIFYYTIWYYFGLVKAI